jgi:hypothetical protein
MRSARALQSPHPRNEPTPLGAIRKGTIMGYNIFYIIGVVVVVALVLAWLF